MPDSSRNIHATVKDYILREFRPGEDPETLRAEAQAHYDELAASS